MDDFTEQWIRPFYLHIMSDNYLALKGKKKGVFIADVNEALYQIDAAIIDRMFSEQNWRTRLVGSWFCGLKGWNQYSRTIADLLRQDQGTYAVQGYAFAFACFADALSVEALKWAVTTYFVADVGGEWGRHCAALQWVDQQQGTSEFLKFSSQVQYAQQIGKTSVEYLSQSVRDFDGYMTFYKARFIIPSVGSYKHALTALIEQNKLSKNLLAMLKFHHSADRRTITAGMLATHMGYVASAAANRYGVLGAMLCYELGIINDVYHLQPVCYPVPSNKEHPHCRWVMRPELTQALEQLNLV